MKKRKNKSDNIVKELLASVIMILSTSIVVFNNVGQSLQLVQLPLSVTQMYWIAGISFAIGAVWISYLNKVIKI